MTYLAEAWKARTPGAAARALAAKDSMLKGVVHAAVDFEGGRC